VDAVGAAAQQAEHVGRLMLELGLAEHPASDRHHGVGGKQEGLGIFRLGLGDLQRGLSLGAGKATHDMARDLALPHALIDGGRPQRIGRDAGLLEKLKTPRRSGGEHQLGAEARARRGRAAAWRAHRRLRLLRRGGHRLGLGGLIPLWLEPAT
jgi:hypothetical protein